MTNVENFRLTDREIRADLPVDGWFQARLEQFVKIRHGYAFGGEFITPDVTPNVLVTPGNFHIGGGFKSSKFKYYAGEVPPTYKLEAGDIVVTMTDLSKDGDSLGYGAKIPASKEKTFLHNQRIGLLEFNGKLVNKDFVYWVLRTREYQAYVLGAATGTSVRHTSPSTIHRYEFELPESLVEQESVSSTLSCLDDKIELLRRQNQTLEAMAETLFRHWFAASTDAAEDLCKINTMIDFNPTRKLTQGILAPYVEMAALRNDGFNPEGWYDRPFSSGMKFINGDTLLARITPCLENGKAAYITFLKEGEVAWGSTEYIVMRPKDCLHPLFAYALARHTDFRDYAEGCLTGSSGRQRVGLEHLRDYAIREPSVAGIAEFNRLAAAIEPKLHANAKQIKTLVALRDNLLPKLMSGEVRVAC